MSQIPCKQSIRIEMTGWFKHYFPGNLRRNFLFEVCNYTSYQNLQKNLSAQPVRKSGGQVEALCQRKAKKNVSAYSRWFKV